ncbi:MAG: shikimate dehydrogenase [Anaerolineae bacterium]|nr:shikimate dehydrogenase [Anaerolineae bacterium]
MNKVGAIGWPIEHSLSPAMHNAAFQALGMNDWFYDKIAIPPDIVKLSLRELRDHGYIGLNVTVPHKQAVMPFVKADAIAKAIGAVNTIDFRNNTGTNTDCSGFMDDLVANGIHISGEAVIVLGAGGAARAAVYGLSGVGAKVMIVNRTRQRAEDLIADLQVNASVMTYEEAAALPVALIVNATSVGLEPKIHESLWPEDLPLPKDAVIYDMVYRPARTRLMQMAEGQGSRVVGGLGMLVRQGAAAFKLWTGVEPPVEVMFSALYEKLSSGP